MIPPNPSQPGEVGTKNIAGKSESRNSKSEFRILNLEVRCLLREISRISEYRVVLCAIALLAAATQVHSAPPLPKLEQRGQATQLLVDGKPFIVLAGETDNTASSNLEYMDAVWPKVVRMNLNTVLVAVSWDWVEETEGKFDFSLVDGLLAGARKNNLHLILLWFGSWKNGLSTFVPEWVKADQQRFPRARLKNGRPVEVLTTLSDAGLQADTRAYTAFLRHIREVDAEQRTVIMIQLQNEVGLIGESRDRSAVAEAAFDGPVPAELITYLQKNRETLWPDLRKLWETAGAKAAGTWSEVFGPTTATDEIFMAWNYARYMGQMAKAGKPNMRCRYSRTPGSSSPRTWCPAIIRPVAPSRS
jgi:beta-galactosidase GanA